MTAEIISGVYGAPANFTGFRVLPSLLQRRRSPEANQTLHDVWPSHGWYTLYTFSGALDGILPGAKNHFMSMSCVRLYWQRYCTELSQRAPPIFGWAAITLGIGPHSSSGCLSRRSQHDDSLTAYMCVLGKVSIFFGGVFGEL